MNIDPETIEAILAGLTDFLMNYLGISFPDVIAQLTPVFQTILGLFA
jgi:hypothetical protein